MSGAAVWVGAIRQTIANRLSSDSTLYRTARPLCIGTRKPRRLVSLSTPQPGIPFGRGQPLDKAYSESQEMVASKS